MGILNKLMGIPLVGSEHGEQLDWMLEVIHWFMTILGSPCRSKVTFGCARSTWTLAPWLAGACTLTCGCVAGVTCTCGWAGCTTCTSGLGWLTETCGCAIATLHVYEDARDDTFFDNGGDDPEVWGELPYFPWNF